MGKVEYKEPKYLAQDWDKHIHYNKNDFVITRTTKEMERYLHYPISVHVVYGMLVGSLCNEETRIFKVGSSGSVLLDNNYWYSIGYLFVGLSSNYIRNGVNR